MTTNSPNPVDGDVQALICALEILKPEIATCPALTKAVDIALAALTAEPVEYQYHYHNYGTGAGQWLPVTNSLAFEQMKIKHAEDGDFSFRKLYTTPPAQLLRPVDLPNAKVIHDGKSEKARHRCEGWNACLTEVQRLNATAQPVSGGCKWSFDDDGYWESACGSTWVFNDGGPIENQCNFCQKCGGKVVLAAAPGGQDGQ